MIEYTVRVYEDRTEWYLNDVLHREGAPAVEFNSGSKFWYEQGLRHKYDGPATEDEGGYREWRIHGKLHREDGPAIEYADGRLAWYLDGDRLTQKQFEKRMKRVSLITRILRFLEVNNEISHR